MSPTEAENVANFRRTYEQMLNRGDLSFVEEVIAPDFVNHEAPAGADRGPDSQRGLVYMLRTAFPDLQFTIEDVIAQDNTVAARLTMRGTHLGPLMGMPPTGRAVEQNHMHFVRFRGGKAVEHWGVRDDMGCSSSWACFRSTGPLERQTPDRPGGIAARLAAIYAFSHLGFRCLVAVVAVATA